MMKILEKLSLDTILIEAEEILTDDQIRPLPELAALLESDFAKYDYVDVEHLRNPQHWKVRFKKVDFRFI